MMKDFIFDIKDYETIPGLQRQWEGSRPFLVPVFFEKNVLTRYLYDPAYECQFHSETYGTIYANDDYISFGINPSGSVIMWLGDVDGLEEKEKLYLLSHNIPSDHNIQSEFYDAQINVTFTDPIIEISILVSKNKVNTSLSAQFGFKLFKTEYSSIDELFASCSKYKKILLGGEDDFKRIISEWNELIIEDINIGALQKQMSGVAGLGSVNLFRKFITETLALPDDLIQPYFILYNLRTWADHHNAQDKFLEAVKRLGLDPSASYLKIYTTLMRQILDFHNNLLNKLAKTK